jgi:hypothetical protein
MNSYKLSVLSFLAGAGLAFFVLAPTVRMLPTLTARNHLLEKEVAEAGGTVGVEALMRRYVDRIVDLEIQINQEHRACANCPCLKTIREKPHT